MKYRDLLFRWVILANVRERLALLYGRDAVEAVLVLKNGDRVPLGRAYRERSEAAFIK